MNTPFADSFYFFALFNGRDAAHGPALVATRACAGRFVTTAWVLTEVADAMSAPKNRPKFLDLVERLRNDPELKVVPPTHGLFDSGVKLYAERSDKDWSLTDCVSFVVMRELGLTEALTGDRHFEQAGFKALLACGVEG